MKRHTAIIEATNAFRREHVEGEEIIGQFQCSHMAISIVDVLEKLGLLKFDDTAPRPSVIVPMPSPTALNIVEGAVFNGLRSANNFPPDVIARQVLADLQRAGFTLVRNAK